MPDATLAHACLGAESQDIPPLDRNTLVHRIGQLIVADPDVNAAPWNGYALIVRYDDGAVARRMSGFRFQDGGGYEAATPHTGPLGDLLDALRDATRIQGKPPWQACVVRIRRDTRKVTLEFEYDDPQRWDIGPETLDAVMERARPG